MATVTQTTATETAAAVQLRLQEQKGPQGSAATGAPEAAERAAEERRLLAGLAGGLAGLLEGGLPAHPGLAAEVPHAPPRTGSLTAAERRLALANALRYFPREFHAELAAEFLAELAEHNHIYMHRFRPTAYPMRAYPQAAYPAACPSAAAVMLMIMNNLDPKVAQFPHELITYGGNGSVFQNWAQYHVTMQYLSQMTDRQTLVMYSGHPHGLFPSLPSSPRVVVTNGMVIPNYSTQDDLDRMYAMGVTQYGQMTAGSYCYIGPQGIVHGTTLTVLNAGRKYLGSADLAGKVYVTSGLGGMSGAQAKAATICGAIGVIAEIDEAALDKRLAQGWVKEKVTDLKQCIARIKEARKNKDVTSIAYLGNVVDLWEALAEEAKAGEMLADLGSDQTSLHNPFNGGYYPAELSFAESQRMMVEDPAHFKSLVQASLLRHIAAVQFLADRGMYFWDYGNAFLVEASKAGADIMNADGFSFKFPSYVQDIMGDIFSLGFGPYRWVCCSGLSSDLDTTDQIAAEVISELQKGATERTAQQYADNYLWITQAKEHQLVVGSQARILYSDAVGRVALARRFNEAVKAGRLQGPVVISRDHHDVSGTDSPFRETSNITDGSQFCADMAVHNCIGDAFRGATWVALHNGGGVGYGKAINGGFGLVLDGSDDAGDRAESMLFWDVNNGVARRSWARNDNAMDSIKRAMAQEPRLRVTLPELADDAMLDAALGAI